METAFTIELFLLSDDPHDQRRFARRRQVDMEGNRVYIPTVEDVVITKLRWAAEAKRSKDAQDVRDVLATQQNRLDWDYVHAWCEKRRPKKARRNPPHRSADLACLN